MEELGIFTLLEYPLLTPLLRDQTRWVNSNTKIEWANFGFDDDLSVSKDEECHIA